MKYKFFAIPARNPELAEAALNAFCSQHRISFIEKHLVADGADSFWPICISWFRQLTKKYTATDSQIKLINNL